MLNQKHIIHEDDINDNDHIKNDVTSQLEGETLKHEDVHGGSGFAAATLRDEGFEHTLGASG
jgi:hypothetical protein